MGPLPADPSMRLDLALLSGLGFKIRPGRCDRLIDGIAFALTPICCVSTVFKVSVYDITNSDLNCALKAQLH